MSSSLNNIFTQDPVVLKKTADSSFSERTLNAIVQFSRKTGLRSCSIPCRVLTEEPSSPGLNIRTVPILPGSNNILRDELLTWFFETFLSLELDNQPQVKKTSQTVWNGELEYNQLNGLVFKKYCESLLITAGAENALLLKGFGEIQITLAQKDKNFIQKVYQKLPEGGICASFIKASHTHQLKPLLIDFEEHNPRRDREWQKIIANAYWQTCWATGAIRGSRGDTEPAVFFPISWKEEKSFFKEIEPGKHISSYQFYLFYLLRIQIQKGAVSFDPTENTFRIQEDCPDRQDLLKFLNNRAFCDLYWGQNAELSQPFLLKRAVAVVGSHLLSRVISEKLGMDSQPDKVPYAGSNSVFFLNFPEEYPLYCTAMNAPVGLLAIDGEIIQPALLKRGCLYHSNSTNNIDIFSLQNMEIILPDQNCWNFQKELEPGVFLFSNNKGQSCFIYSPFYMVHHAKTPAGKTLEFTIVGNRLVEINNQGSHPVPQNGFIISFGQAVPDWHSFPHFKVQYRLKKENRIIPLESAISCGPVLLQNKEMLSADFFDLEKQLHNKTTENFLPYQKEAGYHPLVPTRFPHFTDLVRAPRTFLGVSMNSLYLVVVDGRSTEKHSIGMTLREEARYLSLLNCTEGLNLDGGGSTVLWVKNKNDSQGAIVNVPSDSGHQERLMPVPLILE